MMKRSRSSNSDSSGFRFTAMLAEDHKSPLYTLSFCEQGPGRNTHFVVAGSNRATVYECVPSGDLKMVQCYVDEDESEAYYASGWAIDDATGAPLLLLGGLQAQLKIIDCSQEHVVGALVGHGNSINEIRGHPLDIRLVFSASKDESIRLWNLAAQRCVAVFAGDRGHRDEVLSIDIHPLGNCLASCGMDNTIKLWALDTLELEAAIDRSTQPGSLGLRNENKGIPDLPEQIQAAEAKTAERKEEAERAAAAAAAVEVTGAGTATGTATEAPGAGAGGASSSSLSGSGASESANTGTTASSSAAGKRPHHQQHHHHQQQQQNKKTKKKGPSDAFMPAYFQFPVYSTSKVHSDYVDCVRWVGNQLLSKSTKNEVVLWKPFPQRGRDHFTLLKRFPFPDGDIWFIKFATNPAATAMAVGNKHGRLFMWDLNAKAPQGQIGGAAAAPVRCHKLEHIKCRRTVRQVAFGPDGR